MVGLFFSHEWQQTNEAGSQNGCSDGSLIQSGRAGAATRQNAAFAVDQSSERLQILVVHIDWTRN
jgi:hypothetical protein